MERIIRSWFDDDGWLRFIGERGQRVRVNPNEPTPPPPTNGGEVVLFPPMWKLQSAAEQPSGAEMYGYYCVQGPLVDVQIDLYIDEDTKLGVPSGTGTSRYYFVMPDTIKPNVYGLGIARAWIGGGGQKEYTGAIFHTGNIPDTFALFVTLGGVAMGPSHPKPWVQGSHFHAQIRYRIE